MNRALLECRAARIAHAKGGAALASRPEGGAALANASRPTR